jgi:PAS domain S-box-containing protein
MEQATSHDADRLQLTLEIVRLTNRPSAEGAEVLRAILCAIKKNVGVEAAAIRLAQGVDFPYFEVDGFDDAFVAAESRLCRHGDERSPSCMCGSVLTQRVDTDLPHFTSGGSFWVADMGAFLRDTPAAQLPDDLRGRCARAGYQSLALIPLRCEERTIGLLQLADPRPGRFDAELIAFLEQLGSSIAVASRRLDQLRELEQQRDVAEGMIAMAPIIVLVLDDQGKIVRYNAQMEKVSGFDLDSVVGRDCFSVLLPESERAEAMERFSRVLGGGAAQGQLFPIVSKRGERRFVEWYYKPLFDAEGRQGVLAMGIDVSEQRASESERRALEGQLLQAQKLETIGRLAGGVAHDFNNLLTVIQGNAQLAQGDLKSGDPLLPFLEQIDAATDLAAALTLRLLAFSRRQVTSPEVLDLGKGLQNLDRMLDRLIGELINKRLELPEEPLFIEVDRAQLEQVIMNLVINAADAMPSGGSLTVSVSMRELDASYASRHVGSETGPHALLRVEDTGVGMDAKLQAQIFDPFFTTKPPDKGTGLGLSTVYGIVKQARGHLWVESEPGRGTAFNIYFPLAAERPEQQPEVLGSGGWTHLRGDERVLVVEDQRLVRELAVNTLERHGYQVTAAANGREALTIAQAQRDQPFDLLLTDVVMPLCGGVELAQKLTAEQPELAVLFITGYSETSIDEAKLASHSIVLLPKPFSAERLLVAVREALGGDAAASSKSA